MKYIFPEPLTVGGVDDYTVFPNPQWLEGETIVSVNVTGVGVNVSLPNTDGVGIKARFEGLSKGRFETHWEYETNNRRSSCATVYIDVLEC